MNHICFTSDEQKNIQLLGSHLFRILSADVHASHLLEKNGEQGNTLKREEKIPILNAGRINYYIEKYRHMLGLLIKSGKKIKSKLSMT